MAKRNLSDDMKRILEANKESIEKFKAQRAAKKGGRKARQPIPETEYNDQDAFKNPRAVQQNNPGAWMPTSSAPQAPPSVARNPINVSQSGGVFQGAVAQINAASRALEMPSGPAMGAISQGMGGGVVGGSWANTQKTIGGIFVGKPGQGTVHQGFGYARAPQSAKTIAIEKGKGFDSMIRDDAQSKNAIKDAVKKAIKDDAKEIVRTLREEGREERAEFLKEYKVGERQFAKKQAANKNDDRFLINRAYHLIHKAASVASMGQGVNTSEDQLGPAMQVIAAVAPFLPGFYGKAAYAAAVGLGIGKSGNEGANLSISAEQTLAKLRVTSGNSKLLTRVMDIHDNVRMSQDGMTAWERTKERVQNTMRAVLPSWATGDLEFNGEMRAEHARAVENTVSSYQKARGETYLHGGGADKAIEKYAAAHKIPVSAMSDYTKNKIIDMETRSRRIAIRDSKDFNDYVDAHMPVLTYGKTRAATRDQLAIQTLNDIMDGKIEKYGNTFTDAGARREIEDTISLYLENNQFKIHKQDEISRNIELKTKAERHRHLAEF